MNFLSNFVLPSWVKPVAIAVAVMAIWFHGYSVGLNKAYSEVAQATTKVVYKQGKVTTKVVTKYIKQAEKIEAKAEKVKQEGQAYAIQFPNDDYTFNNYFVRVFNESLPSNLSALPRGADADSSGVAVSEALPVFVNNNTAGVLWELRAKSCEEWAAKQEESAQ
jgi:hypothetical protein